MKSNLEFYRDSDVTVKIGSDVVATIHLRANTITIAEEVELTIPDMEALLARMRRGER